MTGFLNAEGKKPEGMYASLIGQYVKLWIPGGSAIGKVTEVDHRTLRLLPHLVANNYEFSREAWVEKRIPAIVSVEAIHYAQPLKDGEKVLETIANEVNEQNKVNLHKRQKELKEIGYTPEQ